MAYTSFKNFFLLPLFFLALPGLAQNKISHESELREKYAEYFNLNRETVYLQLNKSSLLPEENIWFAAYVFNPKMGLPSLATTNLNVELYNTNAEHIKTKTILINGGKGTGFFDLNTEEFKPGKYL